MPSADLILAFESSCDDTAIALINKGQVCLNIVYTQQEHNIHGGVVPELAARMHENNLLPLLEYAQQKYSFALKDLDLIAYTQEPGLKGSLLCGEAFACSLALALELPVFPVNHIQAHVLANLIDYPNLDFPLLCLTASGGHTQIIHMASPQEWQILQETRDDAAGEALDKIARMLGLNYPGGPEIEKYAQHGNPKHFKLPSPALEDGSYSFSGLKTAVRYLIERERINTPNFIEIYLHDLCASIQMQVIQALLHNFFKTLQKNPGIRSIALSGGVAINKTLRIEFCRKAKQQQLPYYIPAPEYCCDNAAMIGISAYYLFNKI